MGRWGERLAYAWKTFILRRELPYLFGLVITDRCNLDCFYCESKNSGGYHFTSDGALKALRDAYRRGHRSLYFTGGEPMIWTDGGLHLEDLVRYSRELGFHEVFIFTNGTVPLAISDCNYIVTLDGTRDIHESIRQGTYDLILKNVRNAVTRAVFASITFSKHNAHCLEEFVKEITALHLFRGISFNLLTHWPEMVAKHGISGAERVQLLDRIWALKQQGYPIVLSHAAYRSLRNNDWKRPIPQIELGTRDKVFTCCRDVDNKEVCENCGYANCVEVSQIMALKPSALLQVMRMVN
jgi:sulfatase maturation enzyme AslB (radical SAM superfamily)